jgi:hypothetical protein
MGVTRHLTIGLLRRTGRRWAGSGHLGAGSTHPLAGSASGARVRDGRRPARGARRGGRAGARGGSLGLVVGAFLVRAGRSPPSPRDSTRGCLGHAQWLPRWVSAPGGGEGATSRRSACFRGGRGGAQRRFHRPRVPSLSASSVPPLRGLELEAECAAAGALRQIERAAAASAGEQFYWVKTLPGVDSGWRRWYCLCHLPS